MPTTRRRIPRLQHDWMTETHWAWLRGENYDADRDEWFVWHDLNRDDKAIRELDTLDPPRPVPFLESAVTGRRLWSMFGAEITEEHIREYPGTRPLRWWQFDAPKPRQRLGGVGTPRHDRLADAEHYVLGVPDAWITADDVRTYRLIGSDLGVPALDPSDPPLFESEAAYLKRHGILAGAESRLLTAEDFEPVSIFDILDFGAKG
jgi:hypothetical protein